MSTPDILQYLGYADAEGLIWAGREATADEDAATTYGGFLTEARLDAAYGVANAPQVYFKHFPHADLSHVQRTRQLVWNRGDAPLLIVTTPSVLKVYNCYARPSDERHPDEGVLWSFHATEAGLRQLREACGREAMDSGSFWRTSEAGRIDADERVDLQLLEDVGAACDKLEEQRLASRAAQALVGRAVFLQYLWDRRILGNEHLRAELGVEVEKPADLFDGAGGLARVIEWMTDRFNGDLFPITDGERETITREHERVVSLFLRGTDWRSGNQRLWPYDFSVIPTELVSNVYEMFAHSEDPTRAARESVHYTPPILVRRMVRDALQGLDAGATVLDPACGSGVFLVEAFRRLALRARQANGGTIGHTDLVRILTRQVFGVDRWAGAGPIAAFGLYLALLELSRVDMAAKDVKLPKLLGVSLFFDQDAFADWQGGRDPHRAVPERFDVVIGNPPWTSPGPGEKRSSAERYCTDRAPRLPISNRKPYHAFLWRAAELGRVGGRVSMLVPATLFFQDRAQPSVERVLERFSDVRVVNLMHLRRYLFQTKGRGKGATAPAAVLSFTNAPGPDEERVVYWCPKITPQVAKTRHVWVIDDEEKTLPEQVLWHSRWVWKTAFWGTAQDFALMRRIRSSEACERVGKTVADRGWIAGEGWKRNAGREGRPPPSRLLGMPVLGGQGTLAYGVSECGLRALRDADRSDRWRQTRSRLFEGPLVLVKVHPHRGRMHAAFVEHDLVFTNSFWGASLPEADRDLGRYLAAVVNSDVTAYLLFMGPSLWGVERDYVHGNDLEDLPVPRWEAVGGALRREILELEEHLRAEAGQGMDARQSDEHSRMQQCIANAFGLDERDRDLVEDGLAAAVGFFHDPLRAKATEPPTDRDLSEYATVLLEDLRPYLSDAGVHVVCRLARTRSLALVSVVEASSCAEPVSPWDGQAVETVLDRLSPQLRQQVSDALSVRRSLRVYDASQRSVHIVKHTEKRFWTRSAARADAGEVLLDHLW